MTNCGSCHKSVTNDKGTIFFKCPGCAKHEIVRCNTCRQIVAKYRCPACGFEGPN